MFVLSVAVLTSNQFGEDLSGRQFTARCKVLTHRLCSKEHVESETHKQRLGDKVARVGYLGLDESMDITTVNEQGVQWDFTDVEMRNEAFRKIVAKKNILAHGSTSVCQLEVEIESELESHDTERKR